VNIRIQAADLFRPRPIEPDVQVFVRRIATPAAAPWDQARAAGLEAKLAAPLPGDQVIYQVRRLGVWAFRQPGRYIACYVRRSQLAGTLSTEVDVDGRPVKLVFRTRSAHSRHAGVAIGAALTATIAGVSVAAATMNAMATRSFDEERLASLSQLSASKIGEVRRGRAAMRDANCLIAVGAQGRSLNDLLGDLAWASTHKLSEAHLDALHLDRGLLGLEVRGEKSPFRADVSGTMRSTKPLRLGVWLWGLRLRPGESVQPAQACSTP